MSQLPEDAAAWRDRRPGWSQRDELAARQVEVADHWGRLLAQLWAGKRTLPPAPQQFTHPDRPGAVRERRVTSDPGEISRFFRQHMKGGNG